MNFIFPALTALSLLGINPTLAELNDPEDVWENYVLETILTCQFLRDSACGNKTDCDFSAFGAEFEIHRNPIPRVWPPTSQKIVAFVKVAEKKMEMSGVLVENIYILQKLNDKPHLIFMLQAGSRNMLQFTAFVGPAGPMQATQSGSCEEVK